MKKRVIGLIFNSKRLGIDEKKFFKVAKTMNIEIVPFNLACELREEELKEKARKCEIIYNDTGEYISNEIVKTLEEFGSKVVESSKTAYYPEDKWVFYLECERNGIPTPKTILLSCDIESAKKELNEFNQWPVVLKRVYGGRGEFVARAENVKQAIKIIKNFWNKGNERLPIIAQEYINSDSYRVSLIGGEIVQTARKKRSGWKASGCSSERFWRFKVDKNLERIVKKVAKFSKIKISGIDLAKNKGKWLVIEVNAEPSLKLYDCEHENMIRKTLKLLMKLA